MGPIPLGTYSTFKGVQGGGASSRAVRACSSASSALAAWAQEQLGLDDMQWTAIEQLRLGYEWLGLGFVLLFRQVHRGLISSYMDKTSLFPYMDKTSLCPYMDKTSLCPYMDKTFLCSYMDKTVMCPHMEKTFRCPYMDKASLCPYTDKASHTSTRLPIPRQGFPYIDKTSHTSPRLPIRRQGFPYIDKASLTRLPCAQDGLHRVRLHPLCSFVLCSVHSQGHLVYTAVPKVEL